MNIGVLAIYKSIATLYYLGSNRVVTQIFLFDYGKSKVKNGGFWLKFTLPISLPLNDANL